MTGAANLAGLSATALGAAITHVGLAGVQTQGQSADIASALPFGDVTVTDDRPTAVTGALGGAYGYLLALGTGTIAAASSADGFRFVGGWGFRVSDHASAAWLGRAALERVLLCHDGVDEHSPLTLAILARFGDDPNALVAFATTAAPRDFGTVAPLITSHAKDGDLWGCEILKSGANHLVRALATLGFQPGDALCLTGGVGPHYAPYLPSGYLAGSVAAKGNALDGAFDLAKARLAALEGAL